MTTREIFEHGVSVEKTVWRKDGDNISRKKIKRVVATDVNPRSKIQVQDNQNK